MVKEIVDRFKLGIGKISSQKAYKRSFWVDSSEYPCTVKEIDLGIERKLSLYGDSYVYVVGRAMRKNEMRLYEDAGSYLASQSQERSRKRVDAAKESAYNYLMRQTDENTSAYLSNLLAHDIVGNGPFSILMEDKEIDEIIVRHPTSPIMVHIQGYGICTTNLRFRSKEAFRENIDRLIIENEEERTEESPIIEVKIDDAFHLHRIKPYQKGIISARIYRNNM